MSHPTLVNGADVLESTPTPARGAYRAGWVVLAHWPESEDPYVTWWVAEDGIAFMGHYFEDRGEARRDYRERVARERL